MGLNQFQYPYVSLFLYNIRSNKNRKAFHGLYCMEVECIFIDV